jgi:hypothetical protein
MPKTTPKANNQPKGPKGGPARKNVPNGNLPPTENFFAKLSGNLERM